MVRTEGETVQETGRTGTFMDTQKQVQEPSCQLPEFVSVPRSTHFTRTRELNSRTHLTAERHLENVSIASSTK